MTCTEAREHYVQTDSQPGEIQSAMTSADIDYDLTLWPTLENSMSSVWDLIDKDELLNEASGMPPLYVPKPQKPSARPSIAIVDLNNSKESPYENKPKRAIQIGIEVDF